MKRAALVFLSLIFVFAFTKDFSSVVTPVAGEPSAEERLRELEAEIRAIEEAKKEIQSKIDTNNYLIAGYNSYVSNLYGEVLIYQKEIDQLELEIKELELNLEVLNQKIEENKLTISQREKEIDALEKESKLRIKQNYIDFRSNSGAQINASNILSTESINEYFKDTQYLAIIQSETNGVVFKLNELRSQLEIVRQELAERLVQLNKNKETIEIKRNDLAAKRDVIQAKMDIYYAEVAKLNAANNAEKQTIAVFNQEQATKNTEAERIRQEIFNSFTPPAQGEYITTGRPIGNQGCTGLCTGPHLHFSVQINGTWQNPCNYLKPGPLGGACGWGDKLEWPISSPWLNFTSAFGNRCFWWGSTYYCDYHTGADFKGADNSPILAAHNGYVYKGRDPYGANYAIICENTNCNVGLKTGYWHLQ